MEKVTERLALFWLGISGAGTKKLNALLEVYKPCEVWDSIEHEHFQKVLGDAVYKNLIKTKKTKVLEEKIDKLFQKNISIVTRADDTYPERLDQKEVNPPVMLYCMGDISLLKTNCIAVIGARQCSRYGKDAAEKITKELVFGGLTIVAGLATGIDGYAHAETIKSGGKTIAVLGGGFDKIYPSANIPLSQNILNKGGLIVSEYPPEFESTRYTFPERNRIISGLSVGVVIIEAALGSGTLITAECALEQGREVFAVPGNVTSPYSEGTNNLILSGRANMTLGAKQVFEELKMIVPEMKKNTVSGLDILEQTVYNLLEKGARPFDELLIETGMPSGELTALLMGMEIKGAARRLPSNYYSR